MKKVGMPKNFSIVLDYNSVVSVSWYGLQLCMVSQYGPYSEKSVTKFWEW
jgi:hypothetical protein